MQDEYSWESVTDRIQELFTETFRKNAELQLLTHAKELFPSEEGLEQISKKELLLKIARRLGEDDILPFMKLFDAGLTALLITVTAAIILQRERRKK